VRAQRAFPPTPHRRPQPPPVNDPQVVAVGT